jgi:hypothetical protein
VLEHHRRIDGARQAARDLDIDFLERVGLKELAADPEGLLAELNESKE